MNLMLNFKTFRPPGKLYLLFCPPEMAEETRIFRDRFRVDYFCREATEMCAMDRLREGDDGDVHRHLTMFHLGKANGQRIELSIMSVDGVDDGKQKWHSILLHVAMCPDEEAMDQYVADGKAYVESWGRHWVRNR